MPDELQPGIYLTNGVRTVPVTAVKAMAYASYNDLFATPGTHDTDVEELAAEVAWLSACYERRADKVSFVPRAVTKGETEIEEDDLPFDLTDLLWRIEYSLNLYGAAYMFKRRSRGANLLSLQWLDPQTIEPLTNEQQGLYAFRRNLSQPKVWGVDANGLSPDIAWVWLAGMREAEAGVPLARTVRIAGEVLRSLDKFADLFFDQGAMPITLIRVPAATTDQSRDHIEARFARMAAGIKNAFRPIAIRSPELQVERLGTIPADLAMAELTLAKRDAILAATGVPVSLVTGTAVNFATAQQEASNFVANVIGPRCNVIERQLNRHIFTPLGLHLKFKPQELPEMQRDEVQASQAFVNLRNGGMSREAAAYFLGYTAEDLPDDIIMFEEQPELLQPQQPQDVMPSQAPMPTEDNEPAKAADIARWRRKALKALKAGAPAAVPFESEYIPEEEAEMIAGILAEAQTDEEVKTAFELAPFLLQVVAAQPPLSGAPL